jgi:hypothetical protein
MKEDNFIVYLEDDPLNSRKYLKKRPQDSYKKCGHHINYKCSCRGGDGGEHIFDLVNELNFRHSSIKIKKDPSKVYLF